MEVLILANRKKKKPEYKNKKLKKYNIKWVLLISIWTFLLAIAVSTLSENLMRKFDIITAFVTLIIIIHLGVIFDLIGIAVAAANEKPFNSMAANKVLEGKYSLRLVRNAGPVSNFCNDVIGDICGIISGAAGTVIVFKLINVYGFKNGTILSIAMSGFIASLTVGGKALGKEIAIKNANLIIFYTSKIFMLLDTKLGIDILPKLKKDKKRKRDE
ncbi:hypothetical protein BET03_01685 [Thermohalobacter berrensis]|uniref:Mg2+ and Co2+ transporter CorB n=1 Tax=Thermohalobacter berrensis TaxID=99594 RepID=A0A419TBE0_9FIRM|nr:hypothetical protein BET03_01685 [Thermohalobacter berrensis]